MAHVEDRWEKIVDGQRMRTARYGAGNRWRARYVDADGRERSRTFARKGDAERFLVATEADLLRGSYVDPQRAKLTLAAYAERWLAAQPLRPSSRRTYEIYLRTRILAALGARGLGSITPTDVRGLVRSLQQDLAPITVHHMHGLLATILRAAMEDGYLARNPCARTAPGKGARARVVPMTTAQVQAVLEALPVRYRITALLGAGCGLRIGEVLGLRVRSVDSWPASWRWSSSCSCCPGRRRTWLHPRPPAVCASCRCRWSWPMHWPSTCSENPARRRSSCCAAAPADRCGRTPSTPASGVPRSAEPG